MEGKEHIYIGLGYLTYAVAKVDRKIDNTERDQLEKNVEVLAHQFNYQFNLMKHVFLASVEENLSVATSIHIGVSELKKHSYYVNDKEKVSIIKFLKGIASAEPPITQQELEVLNLIQDELDQL